MNETAVDKLSVTSQTYVWQKSMFHVVCLAVNHYHARTVKLSQLMKNGRYCVFSKRDITPVKSFSGGERTRKLDKNPKIVNVYAISFCLDDEIFGAFFSPAIRCREITVRCQNIWKIYNVCESTLMMIIKWLYPNKTLKIDPMLVGCNGQEPSQCPVLLKTNTESNLSSPAHKATQWPH